MASSQEGAEGARGLLLEGGLNTGGTEGARGLPLDGGLKAGRIILLRDNALTTRPRMETTLPTPLLLILGLPPPPPPPPPPPVLILGLLTAERGAVMVIVSAVTLSAEWGGEAAARLSLRLLVRPWGRLNSRQAEGTEEEVSSWHASASMFPSGTCFPLDPVFFGSGRHVHKVVLSETHMNDVKE